MKFDNTARLLVSCPDQHGIVAAVSDFLLRRNANVTDAQQHATAPEGGTFFMRMEFRIEGLPAKLDTLREDFHREIAQRFGMDTTIRHLARRKRVAVMVSRYDHALVELLYRHRAGELDVELTAVVSNHGDLRTLVESFGIAYHFLPVAKLVKSRQEQSVLNILGEVDLVVLARYMQILSPEFVQALSGRIINIHHSFLPAFVGANPYRHAYNRGVKLIGATAHFVTENLDEGPIIEQDVARVTHRHDVADLVRIGREIERTVLAKAVVAFVDDRILVYGNKTVVFD